MQLERDQEKLESGFPSDRANSKEFESGPPGFDGSTSTDPALVMKFQHMTPYPSAWSSPPVRRVHL